MNICSLLNVFSSFSFCTPTDDVTMVHSKYGAIHGLKTNWMIAYEGIPYAQTAERWQKPQPPLSWDNPLEATKKAHKCIDFQSKSSSDASEDCLFLNIYKPLNATAESSLPVVVYFIHSQSIDDVIQQFINRSIIVVTVQYRTDIFGFISLPFEGIPENIGLWDQYQALEFILDTISSFGGDKQKITITGSELSSLTTSIHTVSPVSRDISHQSIFIRQSSFVLGPATNRHMHLISQRFIEDVDCFNDTVTCLMDTPVDQLITAMKPIDYYPVVGDDFLPWSPPEMITDINSKPLLAIVTQSDDVSNSSLSLDTLEQFIREAISPKFGRMSIEVEELLFDHFQESSLEKIRNSIRFDVAMGRELIQKANTSSDVFVMSLDDDSLNMFFKKVNPEDDMEGIFFDSLAAFISTGDPSTDEVTFPSFSTNSSYISLTPQPEVQEDLFGSEIRFWDEMTSYGYDVITGNVREVQYLNTSPMLTHLFMFVVVLVTLI